MLDVRGFMPELYWVCHSLIVAVLFSQLKCPGQQQSLDPRWLIYTLEKRRKSVSEMTTSHCFAFTQLGTNWFRCNWTEYTNELGLTWLIGAHLKKNVSQCIENLLVQGRGFSAFFKPWPYIQAHSTSRLQMCRRIFCSPCSSKDLLTESYSETQGMSWELAQRLQGAPDTWRGPHWTWQNKSTSTEGRSAPGNGFQPCNTLCPGKLHPKDPEIENPDVSGIGSQALALVMVPQHGFNCCSSNTLQLATQSVWEESPFFHVNSSFWRHTGLAISDRCLYVYQMETVWAFVLSSRLPLFINVFIYAFSL